MKRIVSEPRASDNVVDDHIVLQPVESMNFAELKELSKLRESRKKVKGILHIADFAQKVKSDLKSLSVEDGKYEHSLVLKACDIAELFFMDKGCGDIKREAVISVLLPYFKNDAELIAKIIEFIYPMIHKSTIIRRNKKRLWSGLVSVVNFF